MSYHALWATASGHAIKTRLDQDRLNSLTKPFWSTQTDPSIFSSITQDMSAMLLSGVINYGLNLGYSLKAFSVARAMTRARHDNWCTLSSVRLPPLSIRCWIFLRQPANAGAGASSPAWVQIHDGHWKLSCGIVFA